MRPTLTQRQTQILDYLRSYHQQHGYPPTVREIQRAVGYRSPYSIVKHLEVLVREGCVAYRPKTARSWVPVGTLVRVGTMGNFSIPIGG